MDVRLATVCDYAMVSQEGKLSLLGMFDQINPPKLPFVFPQLFLVTVFEAPSVEAGSTKEVRFILDGEDGDPVLTIDQLVHVPQAPVRGQPIVMNNVLGLGGIEFRQPGAYAFHILVGGDERARVPLKVNKPK